MKTGYLWLDREPTAGAVHAEMARLERLGLDLYPNEQMARDDFDNALDDFPHETTLRLVKVEVSTVATMELTRRGWREANEQVAA